MRPVPMRGPSAGFTLLELVVVVTIVGTVAFLTLPRLRLPGAGDDVDAAARWLAAHHHKLRVVAVQERRPYRLHCDLDARRFWATHTGMDEGESAAAFEAGFHLGPQGDIELVRLADGREVRQGLMAVVYFPDGHSYLAQVLLRADGGRRLAVRLESFLPEARLFEEDRPFETAAS